MIDHSSDISLIAEHRANSATYFRQWILWLGLGSAGAAATFLTLAANACDPDQAFGHLLISFWLFLLGIVTAGASLVLSSMRSSALGDYFASAHNREEFKEAAKKLPTIIASPQRLADEANALQNSLLSRAKVEHEKAERAWRSRTIWHVAVLCLLSISASAFVAGTAFPLVFVSLGNHLLGTCDPSKHH